MEVAPCIVLADAGSFFISFIDQQNFLLDSNYSLCPTKSFRLYTLLLNLEIKWYGVPHHFTDDSNTFRAFHRFIVDLCVEGRVLRVWDKLYAILQLLMRLMVASYPFTQTAYAAPSTTGDFFSGSTKA